MCNAILWLLALLVVTGHIHGDDPVTIEDNYMDAEIDGDEEAVVETVEDIAYVSPNVPDGVYFADHFDEVDKVERRWVRSETKKEGIDEDIAKYDGEWKIEAPERQGLRGDLGLVLKSKAKHSAISALLSRPFVFEDRPLVLQYEVLMQDKQECGGAYIKLLSSDKGSADLKKFHDKTPYTIMFGPDKCGNDYKLHFIFRHKNPLNGSLSEKHCKKPKERIEDAFNDKSPHLYRLVLRPDNTFQIYLDHKVVNEGSLLEDFTPAVNPPAEIDDPTDKRPANWDEREKIPDPDAVKPEDWDEEAPETIVDPAATKPDEWLDDEPETIPDPAAEKPSDWDSDMDGEWEAPPVTNPACEEAPGCGVWTPPTIPNPAYKGKWRSPLIDNPGYQGRWAPRRIPNPEFYEDRQPFRMTSVFAVGFELWSMSNMILFDNVLITDDPSVADAWAAQTFDLKKIKMEKESGTLWGRLMKSLNYRPDLWSAYFLYCAVPIGTYIVYLCWRYFEESLVSAILKYTNERPWLWAVYIVVIALPIVLILVFCCGSSSQEKEEIHQTGSAKKTDAVTPDDVLDGEGDLEGEVDEAGEETYSASNNMASNSMIAEEGNGSTEKASVEEEDPAAAPVAAGSGDAPASPRKRRTRKD